MRVDPNGSCGALRRLVGAVTACVLLIAGCSARVGATKSLEKSANDLRAENAALRSQVASLEGALAEARAGMGAGAAERGGAMDAREVAEATPRVVALRIDSLSGLDTRPGRPAMVSVYVRTLDGRERFVPAVGTLTVDVFGAGERGGEVSGEPLLTSTLTPKQLREAYRSGLTGTYYLVEMAADVAAFSSQGELVLHARFEDAASGESIQTTRRRPLSR
jgi:outer membrane murein-binding lipoprotein Lpp